MNGKGLLLSCLILTSLANTPLFAAECKGVTFPDQIQVGGKRLELNGLGLREATLLRFQVYVAALYVQAKSANPDDILKPTQNKRLVLQFLRDVDEKDIAKAWSEGFAAAGDTGSLQERIDRLNGWMEPMTTGKQLSFTYTAGTGVQVNVAGVDKGTLKGDDFARTLFGIWLGANPPNAGLKAGLLGGGCG
jgi:hypothetical protein